MRRLFLAALGVLAVAGVASEEFRGVRLDLPAEMWVPIGMYPHLDPKAGETWMSRGTRWLQIIGQVNNLFDKRYYTGAQLGPLGFTDQETFIARPLPPINGEFPVRHSTFYAPGAPIRGWIGTRLSF